MGIRTGANAPLGCPDFSKAHDEVTLPKGTVVTGFDDVANQQNEYILLETGANHALDADVDFNASYVTSAATADTGAADAIVASASGQYAWFRLKPRQPLS